MMDNVEFYDQVRERSCGRSDAFPFYSAPSLRRFANMRSAVALVLEILSSYLAYSIAKNA